MSTHRRCSHCRSLLRPVISLADAEHRGVWACDHCDLICGQTLSGCVKCLELKKSAYFRNFYR